MLNQILSQQDHSVKLERFLQGQHPHTGLNLSKLAPDFIFTTQTTPPIAAGGVSSSSPFLCQDCGGVGYTTAGYEFAVEYIQCWCSLEDEEPLASDIYILRLIESGEVPSLRLEEIA